MEMFMMMLNMKMLKILHKDSWIGILHQFMILISRMKILWEILCRLIKRKICSRFRLGLSNNL